MSEPGCVNTYMGRAILPGEMDVGGFLERGTHRLPATLWLGRLWKVWQLSADGALVGQDGREGAGSRARFRTWRGENAPRFGGAGRRRGTAQWGLGGLPAHADGDCQGWKTDPPRGLCF